MVQFATINSKLKLILVSVLEIGCELLKGQRLKIGHGGTLDMFATGVMCFGLGAGCKQLHALLHGKKVF